LAGFPFAFDSLDRDFDAHNRFRHSLNEIEISRRIGHAPGLGGR
jgi:hypothetical protein